MADQQHMPEAEYIRVRRMDEEEFAQLPEDTKARYQQQAAANFAERCTMDSVEGVRADGLSMDDFLARCEAERAAKRQQDATGQ